MQLNKKILAFVGVGAMLSLASVGLAMPASAMANESSVLRAVSAVSAASPETLENTASVSTLSTGEFAIEATVAATQIEIPTSSDRALKMGASGQSIAIKIPEGIAASRAEVAKPGVVGFDGADGSITVPAVLADGSLQISTVISSSDSPHSYRYAITADGDSSVVVSDDGRTAMVMSEGTILANIKPAWAKDSRGREVPTRYSTDGKSLTQTIDLS